MTYIKLSGEPVGDGGDQYTGLDRFGRVVDNRWMNSSNVWRASQNYRNKDSISKKKPISIGKSAMKTVIYIFMLVLLTSCSQAQVYPTTKNGYFPTEKEVTNFLKVGLDKQDVVTKFGEPLNKTPQPRGDLIDEIYYYPKPPYKFPKEERFAYGGFQVYFLKNKVFGFNIIHETVKLPSQYK